TRRRQVSSLLRRLRSAVPLWDSVWEPRRDGETQMEAELRLHASRDQLRACIWSATFDPRWLWVEAQIPRPVAIAILQRSELDKLKRLAFIELCRTLGSSFGDEVAVGFAALVNVEKLDRAETRSLLEAVAQGAGCEELRAVLVRLLD